MPYLRGRLVLVFCLFASVPDAAAREVRVRFHVEVNETVNAIYHMACLADGLPCTRPAFERLWNTRLGWTAEDARAEDDWMAVLKKVGGAAPPQQPAPYIGNTVALHPELERRRRVILAALEARSAADLARRTEGLLDLEDAARVRNAIGHFRRRLHSVWLEGLRRRVPERLCRAGRELRRPQASALIARIAAFTGAANAPTDVWVHAIPSPEPKASAANGTWVGNHVLMEVTDSSKPEFMASVTVHEMVHYLYNLVPHATHLDLMRQFATRNTPGASSLYALLNEALACAVQAEMPAGPGETPLADSSYNHPFIPRAGRAAARALKETLDHGGTLQNGFSETYLREAGRVFADYLADPRFILTGTAILPTDAADPAYLVFRREFQPLAFLRSEQYKIFPNLNLVFMHTYSELKGLTGAFPDLAAYTSRRGFAYRGARGEQATVFILAGRDAAAISEVVRALAKVKSVPASGLVLSID